MASFQAQPLQALLDGDPYKSIGLLGHGAYGIVDKVERRSKPGVIFARKTVRVSGPNGPSNLQTAQNEARVIRRLKHQHIISILELYTHRNELSIIMLQVADLDMEKYLDLADSVTEEKQRYAIRLPMQMWPGCLIQAIDYLHEMRVKHKDLKPSNILVKDNHVLIADFGISKDLVDEETTASLITHRPSGTPMYMAPEVTRSSSRGRAVDIFSLGCIFLEIATVIMAAPGSLKRFSEFREIDGHRAYSGCPMKLVQWIWHLWGYWDQYCQLIRRRQLPYDDFLQHGAAVYDLAFLMLDPEPKTRITSRQLVSMMHARELYYRGSIKSKACEDCGEGPVIVQSNLPLHSVYKATDNLLHPETPEAALETNIAANWDEVKRLWLEHHMWWDSQELAE